MKAARWKTFSLFWLMASALLPLGCSQRLSQPNLNGSTPVVRVLLMQSQDHIAVTAAEAPLVRSGRGPMQRLNWPANATVPVSLAAEGWRVGNVSLPPGELTVLPNTEGSVRVNGQAYRGEYRFVPSAMPGHFDLVNDVDIDGYLKSVVSKELLWNWNDEAYKAQAIVARTYALYQARTASAGRAYDLYDDQRSQMYGGIGAESRKSRAAVEYTSGIVVAYGPPGQEKIFKAYFSACCGGVTQSAADAFGDGWIPPLSDQNTHGICNASPRFNWGPIVIRKDELTRRFRSWGAKKGRPEKDMGPVVSVDIQALNRVGRPVRFLVTDARGYRYSWTGEELRWAVNTDAVGPTTLNSSFVKLINDPEVVRFVEGHGWGHGVGFCQWTAERRAEEGMRHEDIVLAAFPQAVLVRGY